MLKALLLLTLDASAQGLQIVGARVYAESETVKPIMLEVRVRNVSDAPIDDGVLLYRFVPPAAPRLRQEGRDRHVQPLRGRDPCGAAPAPGDPQAGLSNALLLSQRVLDDVTQLLYGSAGAVSGPQQRADQDQSRRARKTPGRGW